MAIALLIPVPLGIAAVTPTTLSSLSASSTNFSAKIAVDATGAGFLRESPDAISNAPTPCQCSLLEPAPSATS